MLILDGSSWTEEETLALEVYHKETDDFTAISGRLEQAGFPERSPKEIQEKWDSLNTADDSLQVDRGNKRILIDLKEVFPEEVIVEEVQEEVVEFKHSFNWTSKETRQLVDIYKKLDGSVKPAERWEEISNCMKTRNVFKSSTECGESLNFYLLTFFKLKSTF